MYLGPLVFKEIFVAKPWGGRSLARVSGKKLPPGEPIGESWELADHPHGTSVVAEGPMEGKSLRELAWRHGTSLLGRKARGRRFPLLVKLLDARERLSVQVHPDDRCARSMKLKDPGKTEAWYVIHARSSGRIFGGLKSKRFLRRLAESAADDTLGEQLRTISPKAGEAWLCLAGTVHAIGPGVVLLEIQQNSDSTFRLYDWGRMGLDGKPRPLHIEKSVRAIAGRVLALRLGRPRPLRWLSFPAERLVECDKFVVDRWHVRSPSVRPANPACEILHVVEGDGVLRDSKWPPIRLRRGRTVLVPACVGELEIVPGRPLTIVRAAE